MPRYRPTPRKPFWRQLLAEVFGSRQQSLEPRWQVMPLEERRVLTTLAGVPTDLGDGGPTSDLTTIEPPDVLVQQIGDDLFITGSAEDAVNDTITLSVDDGALSIANANGTVGDGQSPAETVANVSLANFTGDIFVQLGAGNDQLTIDLSGGTFDREVHYDGGEQTSAEGDSLVVTNNAPVASVSHTIVDPSSGSIGLTGNSSINYTGLEPVLVNITAADVTLDFVGGAETITITDAGSGMTTVDSTLGESITFTNPTDRLHITTDSVGAASGVDEVVLQSLGAGFVADIRIETGSGDIVHVTNDIDLGAASLEISAGDRIEVDGNVDAGELSLADAGNTVVSGRITSATLEVIDTTGNVDFNGVVEVTTINFLNLGGDVIFNGEANATTFNTDAGGQHFFFRDGGTITNSVVFANTGGVTIGDDDTDTMMFAGGVTSTASMTNLCGTVMTTNADVTFGSVTLTGVTTINSGAGAGDVVMGAIAGAGTPLEIVAGTGAIDLTNVSNVIGDLTISGATVSLVEADDITQPGPWNTTGTTTLDAGGNDIVLTNTANEFGVLNLTASNVTLVENSDIELSTTTASNVIDLTTSAAIVDALAGDSANIIAGSIVLRAATGIGSADDINVAPAATLSTLAFQNTMANSVSIASSGQLLIDDVGGLTASTNNAPDGSIALTAPELTIDHVLMTAVGLGGEVGVTGTTINADIVASSGTVTLKGGEGTTSLSADITADGSVTFNDAVALGTDVSIDSGSGDISFKRTVDGAHSLEAQTTGVVDFDGPVGGTTPLNQLVVQEASVVTFHEAVNVSSGGIDIDAGTVNILGPLVTPTKIVINAEAIAATNDGINPDIDAHELVITSNSGFAVTTSVPNVAAVNNTSGVIEINNVDATPITITSLPDFDDNAIAGVTNNAVQTELVEPDDAVSLIITGPIAIADDGFLETKRLDDTGMLVTKSRMTQLPEPSFLVIPDTNDLPLVIDGVATVFGEVGVGASDNQNYVLEYDWCIEDGCEPEVIVNQFDDVAGMPWIQDKDSGRIATDDGVLFRETQIYNSNPGSDADFIHIFVSLLVPEDMILPAVEPVTQEVLLELISLAQGPAAVEAPTVKPIDFTRSVTIIRRPNFESGSSSTIVQLSDLGGGQGEAGTTKELRYVLRLVTPTGENGQFEESEDIPLESKLLDVEELASKLPDDRYRVYRINGDVEEFVKEIIVRQGKPFDPPVDDDAVVDKPTSEQKDEPPASESGAEPSTEDSQDEKANPDPDAEPQTTPESIDAIPTTTTPTKTSFDEARGRDVQQAGVTATMLEESHVLMKGGVIIGALAIAARKDNWQQQADATLGRLGTQPARKCGRWLRHLMG